VQARSELWIQYLIGAGIGGCSSSGFQLRFATLRHGGRLPSKRLPLLQLACRTRQHRSNLRSPDSHCKVRHQARSSTSEAQTKSASLTSEPWKRMASMRPKRCSDQNGRAGTPATLVCGATLRVTTAPAATMESSPTRTPGSKTAPAPTIAPRSMCGPRSRSSP
jgi:hypothetical protein